MSRKNADAAPLRLTRNKTIYLLVILFLALYVLAKLSFDISNSLFFNHKDRLNFVIYGPQPTFYSLGINEAGNYAIPFYPDLKTQIPGGYGYYRIGALGKLVELEKKPDLFKNTFASITSTFVDYYFYEGKDDVFYGGKGDDNAVMKPQWQQIAYMKSNATFFDRLYILLFINRLQGGSVYDVTALPYKRLKDDTVFRNDNFLEKYIGSFYQKTYRNENLNVQILYTKKDSYNTASLLSNLLNGNGIVVGDISQKDLKITTCIVEESVGKEHSKTARAIAQYFGCKLETGDTEVYDILFELGNLESSWEVD